MPIEGGVGAALPHSDSTMKRRWLDVRPRCGGTEHPAHEWRESEAETKRPPINKKSTSRKILHQVQILHVVGMDLHLMQVLFLVFLFVLEVEVNTANIGYCDDENHH